MVNTRKLINSMKRQEPKLTPIASNMIIPNHSGDHTKGTTTKPQIKNQLANKEYVDDTVKKEAIYTRRKDKAIVTFVIDDGYESDYNIMLPMFNTQGEVACSAIITDKIGTSGRMNANQIKALETAGWEILSHTVSHPSLSGETEENIRTELQNSKDILENYGLTINNVVYPYGDANELVRQVTREIYRSGRGVVSGLNGTYDTIKTFKLFSEVADDDTQLAAYESLVDEAESEKKWLIFRLHNTDSNDATTISSLIDYIQAKNIEIMTINQALDEIGNLIDCGEHFKVNDEGTSLGNTTFENGGMCYGEIYVYDNTTADSIASGSYTQFTRFDTVGKWNNTSSNQVQDHIKITRAGKYLINVSCAFSGDGAVEWTGGIFKNNGATQLENLQTSRKLGAGGDVGSISINGIAELAVDDTVELWFKHTAGVNKNITVKHCTLSIVQIGG